MDIINPLPPAIVTAVTGEALRVIVVPIGAWNMDNTLTVRITPPITCEYIRNLQVLIIDDLNQGYYDLMFGKAIGVDHGVHGSYSVDISTNEIILERRENGWFDSISYDSVGISRGNIFIWFRM